MLGLVYLSFTFLVILIKLLNIKSLLGYGKTTSTNAFQINKSYFRHFYIVGSIISLTLLILPSPRILVDYNLVSINGSTPKLNSQIALFLMFLQTARRLYEQTYIVTRTNSAMHIAHYLVGVWYYSFTPLTIISSVNLYSEAAYVNILVGALVFLVGYTQQYVVHSQLAYMRGKKSGYSFPKGLFPIYDFLMLC